MSKEQILEVIMVEHYTAILPFRPPNWVLCNQPETLEEAITLMEAYALAETSFLTCSKGMKEERCKQTSTGGGTDRHRGGL